MAELSGLAAVVTGGGSGIGLAAARLLAERGAKVAVLDLKPGEEFTGLSADVSDDASVRQAIDKAAQTLGGIDILVNNAGIGAIGTVADNPDALEHRQPMGRLVSADEVAAAIAYLASPLAASVTGTTLAIDGGMAAVRIRPRS
jgi:2-keto-3-deoxy-L-fuconate dehydrogenase